jgi:hypothetical protein
MDRPHLIEGRRYTLRIWIVLVSLDPFVAYICRQGLVKCTAHAYGTDAETLADPVSHLTNSDVQKLAPGGLAPLLGMDDFAALLRSEGNDSDAVWESIRTACARTVLLTRQTLQEHATENVTDPTPFELFGFDIMMDNDLRPWVIEMNRNPDMRAVWGEDGPESAIKHLALGDLIDLTFPQAGADPFPSTCGSWELLFPNPQADQWKEDWMPSDLDREVFRKHGFSAPQTFGHNLLRHARFVDDGAVLFSPGRSEFLALNDSATMIALRNDEGEAATDETLTLLKKIWQIIAFSAKESPASIALTHAVPRDAMQPEDCFALGPIRILCSSPKVTHSLQALLPTAERPSPADETIHIVPAAADQVRILSRLETKTCRANTAIGFLFSLARYLLLDQPEGVASFAGAALRFGDKSILLCGLPLRGKSTLAASLILSGAELISDDMVQLDASGKALPMPLPLYLRPDSWAMLRDALQDNPGKLTDHAHEHNESKLAFAQTAPSTPVRVFLFLRLKPGEATTLTPLGVCESLQRLRDSGLHLKQNPRMADGMAVLRTLTAASRYELVIGSLQAAEAAVWSLANA